MFLSSGDRARSPSLNGSEIFDLEWQMQADQSEESSLDKIHERDRNIGLRWQNSLKREVDFRKTRISAAEFRQLLRYWLTQVLPDSPGKRFFSSFRNSMRVMMLISFLFGYAAMSVVSYYDGSNPVNAFHFLMFFVGFQFVLALLASLSLRYIVFHKNQHLNLGLFQQIMAKILLSLHRWRERLLDRKDLLGSKKSSHLSPFIGSLSTMWSLLLFQGLQTISLFFLAGSLTCFLLLVVFSDLAFAWGSTLQISVDKVHALVHTLAIPWSWWQPEWVPSLEVLEKTQYFRIEARYAETTAAARTTDPKILGQWWTFLCMSFITYGILPRFGLWIAAKIALQRYFQNFDLNSLSFRELQRRLITPHIKWESSESEDQLEMKSRGQTASLLPDLNQRGILILWRDLPAAESNLIQYYRQKFHIVIEQTHKLDGSQKNLQDIISKMQKESLSDMTILISVEDFEEPGKAIQKLIHSLRSAVGEKVPIQVHLLQIAEQTIHEATLDRFRLWQRFFKSFQDPYLGIYSGE